MKGSLHREGLEDMWTSLISTLDEGKVKGGKSLDELLSVWIMSVVQAQGASHESCVTPHMGASMLMMQLFYIVVI